MRGESGGKRKEEKELMLIGHKRDIKDIIVGGEEKMRRGEGEVRLRE